jgi:hypothetical protein
MAPKRIARLGVLLRSVVPRDVHTIPLAQKERETSPHPKQ